MSTNLLPFSCQRCGACCKAPGEVWLDADEVDTIALILGLSTEEFIARYTRLTRDRQALALTEREDGGCVFLDSNNLCRIQSAKPRQCQDYPHHWRSPLLDAACPALVAAGHHEEA